MGFAVAAGVILFIILLASFVMYRLCFYTPLKGQNDPLRKIEGEQLDVFHERTTKAINRLIQMPYEPVSVRSYDGLILTGNYYEFNSGAPVCICFHGWRGLNIRDFCGGAYALEKLGYNVLLVHQRGHGTSEGHTLTFGIKERRDAVTWAEFVQQKYGQNVKIFLYGISMGAATVLMASGLELPSAVKGIVADAPYSSPKDIIQDVCRKDYHVPGWLAYPFIWLGASLFGHFNLQGCTAAEEVKQAKVPILLIHGEDDRFVPCEMSRKIAENSPLIRRETFPDAGHGISYLVDTERYVKLVNEFMDACLKEDIHEN